VPPDGTTWSRGWLVKSGGAMIRRVQEVAAAP